MPTPKTTPAPEAANKISEPSIAREIACSDISKLAIPTAAAFGVGFVSGPFAPLTGGGTALGLTSIQQGLCEGKLELKTTLWALIGGITGGYGSILLKGSLAGAGAASSGPAFAILSNGELINKMQEIVGKMPEKYAPAIAHVSACVERLGALGLLDAAKNIKAMEPDKVPLYRDVLCRLANSAQFQKHAEKALKLLQ